MEMEQSDPALINLGRQRKPLSAFHRRRLEYARSDRKYAEELHKAFEKRAPSPASTSAASGKNGGV